MFVFSRRGSYVEPHYRDRLDIKAKKLYLLKRVGGSGCDVCFLFEMHKHTHTGYRAYPAFS